MTQNTTESAVLTRISEIVTPIVSDLGLDLYDLEFVSGIVRIVVDTKSGVVGENGRPAGVDLEKIGLLTRLVSREFDHSEPVPGRYTLEVTSPGLERNLRITNRNFQAVFFAHDNLFVVGTHEQTVHASLARGFKWCGQAHADNFVQLSHVMAWHAQVALKTRTSNFQRITTRHGL